MSHLVALCLFLTTVSLASSPPDSGQDARRQADYAAYHRIIIDAHKRIANQDYQAALALHRQVFDTYAFVFARDYKVATQLALQTGQTQEAFTYLKKAISAGWTLRAIKKNVLIQPLQRDPRWRLIEARYDSLRSRYRQGGNQPVRSSVGKMFRKDQRKALLALFIPGDKARIRYAEKRFAPQSAQQVTQLIQLIDTYGYPGERLIHNGYWAAVILSHHNSISKRYALRDTLYPLVRPKLLKALQSGQLSPYEFAMIDDWYTAVKSDSQETHFGYLSRSLTRTATNEVNQAREAIGLDSIETISLLADLQQQTGFDVYLPSGMTRKITITE
ncbi:hypothetical protein CLV58_10142 [Spirosoma oryzae]|uniref:Uncharacterized protein n=1 Tax=Spirosoma oryzae TaxID=1469603 RepID=A0A2T0TN72_9BACT|nr:hypothetical protein [Spirosoma oryzae]PRY46978.1 hypothetical protein CLV58_10142 [Spirosoma oryzae]